MIQMFLRNYLPRHRHPVNQMLHLVGVPLSFVVAPILAVTGAAWYWHVGCFVGGYVLQFAGHSIEGNDAGEVVFVKKKLGLSYTEYGQHAYASSSSDATDDTNSAAN